MSNVMVMPQVMTTSVMTYNTYSAVTTDAYGSVLEVLDPVREAAKYIKENIQETNEWIFHLCKCDYCFSDYPANLEIGYECPSCGAYSFEIVRSIEK